MKTDRELLEAAAKAVGWEWMPAGTADKTAQGWLDPKSGTMHWDDIWNPLTDDGDALRLAVKLRLSISIDDRPVGVVRVYVPSDSVPATDEPTGGDLAAATRRAIVRAAAAIAKEG